MLAINNIFGASFGNLFQIRRRAAPVLGSFWATRSLKFESRGERLPSEAISGRKGVQLVISPSAGQPLGQLEVRPCFSAMLPLLASPAAAGLPYSSSRVRFLPFVFSSSSSWLHACVYLYVSQYVCLYYGGILGPSVRPCACVCVCAWVLRPYHTYIRHTS